MHRPSKWRAGQEGACGVHAQPHPTSLTDGDRPAGCANQIGSGDAQLRDRRPCAELHEGAWAAPSADLIGDVRLGSRASIWFGAVIRRQHPIIIGAESNVQDGAVAIATPARDHRRGRYGRHQAILHGCRFHDGALIGMGARVLNGAVSARGAWSGRGVGHRRQDIRAANADRGLPRTGDPRADRAGGAALACRRRITPTSHALCARPEGALATI